MTTLAFHFMIGLDKILRMHLEQQHVYDMNAKTLETIRSKLYILF